ncbi:MAG: radical SAM protein [Deltaproteobacteria bacterium]|nr:radical SAM protein [Deltaproteobacteria bacterium]
MLLVELSPRCNNACVFCSQALERCNGIREVDDVYVQQVLSAAAGARVAVVGGEPTLDPRLPGICVRARQAGAQAIVVQTNARMLAYPRYAGELAQAGVSALEVSLQGSSVPMHDYHTAVSGSFKQTVRGIANAVAAGMSVSVTTVVTRSNLRHLSEIVRVVHALGARALRLRRVHPVGRALELQQRLVPAAVLAAQHLQQARLVGDQLGVPVFFEVVADEALGFVDFVGGQEPAEPEASMSLKDAQAALVVERARPALTEDRGRDRLSGQALRELFPDLFEPASEGR